MTDPDDMIVDLEDLPEIDPEEAAREALLLQKEAEVAAQRQAEFTAEYGQQITDMSAAMLPYGITEMVGYPGWDPDTAERAPKMDITGDAATLVWIITRMYLMVPRTANRLLQTRAPWLKPMYQIATGQPLTPSKSIETITVFGADAFEALGAIAYTAHGDLIVRGMMEVPPEPEDDAPSPWAGVLRKVQ